MLVHIGIRPLECQIKNRNVSTRKGILVCQLQLIAVNLIHKRICTSIGTLRAILATDVTLVQLLVDVPNMVTF